MSKQEGNNGEFEQSWKSAFSDTEITPPSRVWSEIDHGLTQTQLSSLQKKTAVYKWTAAAAVIFAAFLSGMALSLNYVTIAAWFGFNAGEPNLETVAQLDDEESQTHSGSYAGFSILRNDFATSSAQQEEVTETNKTGPTTVVNSIPTEKLIVSRSTPPVTTSIKSEDVLQDLFKDTHFSKPLLGLSTSDVSRSIHIPLIRKSGEGLLAVSTPDPASFGVNGVMVHEVRRPVFNAEGKTRFWSGIDLASGYFNPNYDPSALVSSQEQLLKDAGSRQVVPELSENMRGGAAYSIGINFGMKFKNRWSIEAAALYSLLGARTFTNLVLESETFNSAVAYSSEIAGLESVANLVESELTRLSVDDIQINNTFQFISFPVLAGYKLIDKRFNVTLNGGLAANLYLGNHLRGTRNFTSFELVPGRRSPYRSLTLAAVTGFEIGYWIHRRVNLCIEPSFQKNLQSLTKNDASFVANPSGVNLQVGFKYDF